MNNFIVISDGRPLAEVERRLAKYLPGLDVRLFAFSQHQAILRGTLLRALEIEYPSIPLLQLLAVCGVADLKPIGDEASATILAARDAIDLPARTGVAAATRAARAAVGLDWHLVQVRVPQAWQLLGGPDAIAWNGTKVGHIDTGYTGHPAFGFPATWLDTANAETFFPASDNADATPIAELGAGLDNGIGVSAGHGTKIGGTICGHDDSASGGPFFGVAPKVPVVEVRITDIVLINHAQREFEQAVTHLLAQGVGVINVSLGVFLGTMRRELRRAVNAAYDAGVIMVCAAGNHVNSVVGPASLVRTVAVAGVTRDDTPWSGSSFGPEVDFSAPAADLRRASVRGTSSFSYGFGGDGTSYATAMTTGAAALWLTHRAAELDAAYPQRWQRIEAFRALARATARVPAVWQPGSFGTGVLDVAALLDADLPAASDLAQAEAA
ncbi:S8 family peptidase [Rivibacter subsaxonicus]|uniref:Subtilase family protein n=1 Tax=Rivibacter subsaxonicus TaxID=457575 RepID=A0A4Q7VG29_9BURK|nr:S8 family serine peptidase [Rivibacter subsaxonicus]RZT94962.1 subtilase family protein [Rivibacter subsaxonicus]